MTDSDNEILSLNDFLDELEVTLGYTRGNGPGYMKCLEDVKKLKETEKKNIDPEEYEEFTDLASTYSDGSAGGLQYAIEKMEEENEELESKVEQYSDDADRCLEAEEEVEELKYEKEKLEERIVNIRKKAEEMNHEGWLKIALRDTEFKELQEENKKQQEDIE